MTEAKLPYFKLYVQDFMGDARVQLMNGTERGIYISLLCHSWQVGPLPNRPQALAHVCGVTPEEMERAWPQVAPCFEDRGDGLVNPRMERERQKAGAKVRQAREAARASWESRREQAGAAADAGADADADADADAGLIADAMEHESSELRAQRTTEKPEAGETDTPKPDDLEEKLHGIWCRHLGGSGRQPSLTSKRRKKYRLLYDEQLRFRSEPLEHMERICLAVLLSEHHMSKRDYQMPDSLFRSEERRELWAEKGDQVTERASELADLSPGDRRVIDIREKLERIHLEAG